MSERYDPSDFTTYGAEDEAELDMILDALEKTAEESPRTTVDKPASGQ